MSRSVFLVALSISMSSSIPAPAATVTTGSLLQEATDLSILTKFPDPPYKTIQFSSNDRHSLAPYSPGWYANNDGFGGENPPNFLKVLEAPGASGGGRYLLAEVDGPGAIVRTWTAKIDGEVEVYLDGAEAPVYEGPAGDFLRYTYSVFAIDQKLIDEKVEDGFHQREACYFPIPFAKGLRVVWIGDLKATHFYHLECRLYPEGTPVETFSPSDVKTYAKEVEAALAQLATNRVERKPKGELAPETSGPIEIEPGKAEELFRFEGTSSIVHLALKVDSENPHALRQLVLKGYFDGAALPQIEAPVGDFFGSGPGLSPYSSFPMNVKSDGWMTCDFEMPFKEGALFRIENRGGASAKVDRFVMLSDYDWDDERSLHFFAKWRVDHNLVAQGEEAPVYDLPYLSARGKGVYVGTALCVLNPTGVPTSGGNWWGEGDEKIWFDDDRFPSFFGTGSEDYFNYAWSQPDLFHYAYFAQPWVTGPDNRGVNVNLRWHILDPMPFEERIDFFMELFHHTRTEGISYARTAYFYGTPEIRDSNRPIQTADLVQGLETPANWEPVALGRASGSTFFQAEEAVKEKSKVETVKGNLWSAGAAVSWAPGAEEERLEFEFEAPKAGRYEIVGTFALTPASGKVGVALDDLKLFGHVGDLYTPHLDILRNVWFGARELSEGTHTLSLISRGKNEASGGNRIGLDFLWIHPVD